jgi:hypothetical protein
MRKLSLLIGALGGALAGYLFSNKQLRKDLATAKSAESAAKLLGKHLQRDGKKLAEQVQDFVESEEVQRNWKKAKEYAHASFVSARRELMSLMRRAGETAGDAAQRTGKVAKSAAKKAIRKARKTVRRVETKVRKLM